MITEKDIGRRVIVNGRHCGVAFTNEPGVIRSITNVLGVGVEFDKSPQIYCFDENAIDFIDDEYDSLKKVLKDAEEQSSKFKGKERHANNNKYEDQVICVVGRLLKDHPFGAHAYQVIKKTIEAGRLYKIKGPEAAYQEMLGSINYAAAMNILIKEGDKKWKPTSIQWPEVLLLLQV